MSNLLDKEIPEDYKNREILKTQNMIEEGFFNNLKKTDKKMANKIGEMPLSQSTQTVSTNTEELMLNLYAVRDGLIESFETISLNTAVASNLANHINKLGSCIRDIGGRVDDFIPLEHVSGLKTPDINLNAKKVIETTKQCYTLGEITKAKIENDGQTIFIQFEGKEENIVYKARGTVTASLSWKGNEAIDYIYTSGSGRMSVKSFENNRWIDNSNNNDYNIYWELDEINLETEMKKNEKSYENKKELTIEEQNNTNNEKNDVIPIQEI